MKAKAPLRSFLFAAGSSLLAISSAHAQVYWDTDGTTAGFGTASGTWGTNAFWNTSATGEAGTFNTTNATSIPVNFGNGATGLGSGTINVGTVTSGDMTFASGSGAITLSGGTLTLPAAATITVLNAADTINSEISGAATSLNKLGKGTLKLTGANSYTGATIVSAGTLDLGGSGTTGSIAGTLLTLAGGAFHYTRTDVATKTFTTTNINAVESSISVTDADAKLNLGTVARATGVTFDFATTGSGIVAALTASNTGGIMAGFTLGNSWAVANGVNTAITGLASYTATTGLAANAYSDNIDVDSIATPDANITVNSLRFSEGAANILNLSGTTNTITTGGILVSSGVGNNLSTITGGTLVGAASKDLSIIQKNTLNSLTISSIIANNTGATTLAKSGAGTLILSGANSYTGTTAIHRGTLQVNSGGTLGAITAPLTMGTGVEGTLGNAANLTLNTSAQVGAFTVKSNTSDTSTPSNINQLSIASGSTLTASSFTAGITVANYTPTNTALSTGSTPGAGGTLTVSGTTTIGLTGPADFFLSTTVVDLRGLQTFNSGALNVGLGFNSKAALYLANNANTINGAISVGESVINYNFAGVSHLYLGAGTNALQGAITIGKAKGAGQLLFAGPSGSVTITGAGGSGSSAITIGNHSQKTTYQGTATNSLLLAGHTATVSASTVTLGTIGDNVGGGNALDSLLTFDTGTFTATSIDMVVAGATRDNLTHPINSTVTIGGDTANSAATGIMTVGGDILLGNNDTNGALNSTLVTSATLTINGGTLNVNVTTPSSIEGIFDSSATTTSSHTSTLTLAGGTLNLNGGRIGGNLTESIDNLNFQSGTLMNVASINGNGGLTKTTSGTLTLAGTHSYTGATTVNAGTLILGEDDCVANTSNVVIGAGTLSAGNSVTDSVGTLDVTAATINLGTGAKLTFANSSGVDWTGGTLNITGFVSGSSLNFGSPTGLTGTQLGKISASGFSNFSLDLEGDLIADNSGQTQYQAWAIGGVAFDADTNGDGVKNGLAFLLGASGPNVSALSLLPTVTQSGGNLILNFKCRNTAKRGTAVLKVQYSRDLGIADLWAAHDSAVVPGTAPVSTTVGGVNFVTSAFDANLNNVQATIPASAALPGTKLFARLSATEN